MSRNDIADMSVSERLQLMEEIWTSFDRENIDIPTPLWHEEVLNERAKKDDSHFIPFEEAKQKLYEELNAYKNS